MLQNRRGGASEVLPLQKEGAGRVFAILKGATTSFGVSFNMNACLRFRPYWREGTKGLHPSKGGGGHIKFYTVLRGRGGRKRFQTCYFPIL